MPEISYELSGSNKWQRIYYQQHQGNLDNKKIRAPLIDPFEIPFLLDRHILAVQTFCSSSKPKWRSAGYLTQVFGNLQLDEGSPIISSPGSALDAKSEFIRLNTTQLVIFPKIKSDFYLWFDPAPWLPTLAFGLWQFVGESSDPLTELIETVKVDVLRVESKIDALK